MAINVLLSIERDGRAIAVGRVTDPKTVLHVARRCIREKRLETANACRVDSELGFVARGELRHTEQILGMLIPGLGF